ncbi:redoxin domain-containing protein [Flavobacteriaceae bacterium TK19130]|nr:redoxin domain-containing protein [Thermobacterium salinum]
MGRKLLFLFILIPLFLHGQDRGEGKLLSQAIGENIKRYKIQSQLAYGADDVERAEFLFDSLITKVINGSILDNFKVKKRSGRNIELYDFEKPMFLMTYASWCTPGKGEIPALNEIAAEYSDYIDFVVLYWDNRKEMRKRTKEYSRDITIIYIDEAENNHSHIIETLKHSVGFPTSFFIDADKTIVDVRRGALHPYNESYEVSFELNYKAFYNGISLLKNLSDKENNEGVVSSEDPNP